MNSQVREITLYEKVSINTSIKRQHAVETQTAIGEKDFFFLQATYKRILLSLLFTCLIARSEMNVLIYTSYGKYSSLEEIFYQNDTDLTD